jgi:hypothetical protein
MQDKPRINYTCRSDSPGPSSVYLTHMLHNFVSQHLVLFNMK